MQLFSGIGALFGLGAGLVGGKKQIVAQPGMPTRDDARAAMDRGDMLLRRKGAAADILNGTSGAELTGRVGRLVVGN